MALCGRLLLLPLVLMVLLPVTRSSRPFSVASSLASPPGWSSPGMAKTIYALPASHVAKFRCRATGNPTPTLDWYKNGKDVRQLQRLGGFKIKQRAWTLTLETVLPSDKGNYTCAAHNTHGRIERHFVLDVVERLAHRPLLKAGLPANQTAVAGARVEFACSVFSDPQPHVKWIKVDNASRLVGPHELPDGPVVKDAWDEDPQVLTLTKVSAADAGEYACVAENEMGISYQSAWLTVLESKRNLRPKARWHLAARNVLVTQDLVMKIADFGLA
uniref:receptor protein-tyrosine kinase n=1 Tax=Hippocampus comes TaxID=109280 RepID=A0A3Q2YX92_HIPCM